MRGGRCVWGLGAAGLKRGRIACGSASHACFPRLYPPSQPPRAHLPHGPAHEVLTFPCDPILNDYSQNNRFLSSQKKGSIRPIPFCSNAPGSTPSARRWNLGRARWHLGRDPGPPTAHLGPPSDHRAHMIPDLNLCPLNRPASDPCAVGLSTRLRDKKAGSAPPSRVRPNRMQTAPGHPQGKGRWGG